MRGYARLLSLVHENDGANGRLRCNSLKVTRSLQDSKVVDGSRSEGKVNRIRCNIIFNSTKEQIICIE